MLPGSELGNASADGAFEGRRPSWTGGGPPLPDGSPEGASHSRALGSSADRVRNLSERKKTASGAIGITSRNSPIFVQQGVQILVRQGRPSAETGIKPTGTPSPCASAKDPEVQKFRQTWRGSKTGGEGAVRFVAVPLHTPCPFF